MNLINGLVIVNDLNNKQVTLNWNDSTDVTKYKVYRSAVPYGNFSEIATIDGLTTYTDTIPTIPINNWYYMAAEFDGTNVGPLPQYGQTFIDYNVFNEDPFTQPNFLNTWNVQDMKVYFDQIIQRNLWMLQNDGEDMYLLKRRYEGATCSFVDSESEQCSHPLGEPRDPVTGGPNLANACFGTGFISGYYPAIKIRVRRWDSDHMIQTAPVGFRNEIEPTLWTMPYPEINTGDLFVNLKNERFVVTSIPKFGLMFRTYRTHQEMRVKQMFPRDIVYQVPVNL